MAFACGICESHVGMGAESDTTYAADKPDEQQFIFKNGEKRMMINKRLIATVSESKKYVAGNVALQWCALAVNIAMIGAICRLLERLFWGTAGNYDLLLTAWAAALAVAVRFACNIGSA